MSNVNRTISRDSGLFGRHNWNEPEPPRTRRRPFGGEPLRAVVNLETGQRTYTRGSPANAEPLQYACAVSRKPYLKREVRDAAAEKRLKRQLSRAVTVLDHSSKGRGAGEWNLRTTAERTRAAERAEHPVIGKRFHLNQLATLDTSGRNPEGCGYSPLDVAELNNQERFEKRQRRQEGGISARRRRRGW
jgi:hypothetical protein